MSKFPAHPNTQNNQICQHQNSWNNPIHKTIIYDKLWQPAFAEPSDFIYPPFVKLLIMLLCNAMPIVLSWHAWLQIPQSVLLHQANLIVRLGTFPVLPVASTLHAS